jgi:leucyl aminopeptidase
MNVDISLTQAPFPGEGEALILCVFKDEVSSDKRCKAMDSETNGRLFKKGAATDFTGKDDQILSLEYNGSYEQVYLVGLGKRDSFSLPQWKERLGEVLRRMQHDRVMTGTVFYFDMLGNDSYQIGATLAEAVHLTNYAFLVYKSQKDKEKHVQIQAITLSVESKSTYKQQKSSFTDGVAYGAHVSDSINLARDLINEPPMKLSPDYLATTAQQIEQRSSGKVSVQIFDKEDCEKKGMGAFLAVAQGSDFEPHFITLRYTPKKKPKKTICFIGKSITYDSGGLSLKPAQFLVDMKTDMTGGAIVLGLFHALAQWDEKAYGDIPYEIHGVLPACENMISGRSYRPDDVLTSMSGKTIEVINTDAEGRLTLADALTYAQKEIKPDMLIDIATLTGAEVVALGKQYAAYFTDDQHLSDTFDQVFQATGEKIWRLPLVPEYKKGLKSRIADIRHHDNARWAGAITAALFLQEFVSTPSWAHIDIGMSSFNDEAAGGIIPEGGTGWGVKTLIELIKSKNLW